MSVIDANVRRLGRFPNSRQQLTGSNGPPTAALCSMCGSMTTTARAGSSPRLGTDAADTIYDEQLDAGFFLPPRHHAKPHATSWSMSTITSRAKSASIAPRIRRSRRDFSARREPSTNITSPISATGSSSSPIQTAPRITARRSADPPGRENWRALDPHRPGRLILDLAPSRITSHGSSARMLCRALSCADAPGAAHDIAFEEEAYALGILRAMSSTPKCASPIPRRQRPRRCGTTTCRRARACCLRPRKFLRPRPRRTTSRAASWRRRRRRAGADHAALSQGRRSRSATPVLLYGYGAYGISIAAGFGTVRFARRSRLHLCDCPYPRRQGQGLSLVPRPAAREEVNSFTDFIAAAEISCGGFTRGDASSPMAAAPAEC